MIALTSRACIWTTAARSMVYVRTSHHLQQRQGSDVQGSWLRL